MSELDWVGPTIEEISFQELVQQRMKDYEEIHGERPTMLRIGVNHNIRMLNASAFMGMAILFMEGWQAGEFTVSAYEAEAFDSEEIDVMQDYQREIEEAKENIRRIWPARHFHSETRLLRNWIDVCRSGQNAIRSFRELNQPAEFTGFNALFRGPRQ